jgi:hypothetical protein
LERVGLKVIKSKFHCHSFSILAPLPSSDWINYITKMEKKRSFFSKREEREKEATFPQKFAFFLKKTPPSFLFFISDGGQTGTHPQIFCSLFLGTDRLEAEKRKNLKFENFLFPLFYLIVDKKK